MQTPDKIRLYSSQGKDLFLLLPQFIFEDGKDSIFDEESTALSIIADTEFTFRGNECGLVIIISILGFGFLYGAAGDEPIENNVI